MHSKYCVTLENIDAMLVCKLGMIIVGFSSTLNYVPEVTLMVIELAFEMKI
jgi:hypothetical protein